MLLHLSDTADAPLQPSNPSEPPRILSHGGNGSPPSAGRTYWKRGITSYKDDLRAIRFSSLEALFAVIDLFWDETELRGAPRMPLGGTTLLVPTEAAEILEELGITFEDEPIAKSETFPPKSLRILRRRSSMVSGVKEKSISM